MNKVYLVSAKRSAIGSMLGTLKDVSATWLGSQVLKAALADAKVDPAWLDEVVVGNVLPAGAGRRRNGCRVVLPDLHFCAESDAGH